jgi:hypothetical protein
MTALPTPGGTAVPRKLSAPRRATVPPRALTPDEEGTILRVADALIPGHGTDPRASDAPDYLRWLDLAMAARSESFEVLTTALGGLHDAGDVWQALKTLSVTDPSAFHLLSSVVAGAYLMVPEVREAVGYPGQHRDPPGVEEAVDQISDGILDPVHDRGPTFTPVPGR